MKKAIVYSGSDGIASVVYQVDNSLTIGEIVSKSVPYGVQYSVISEAEIPKDRIFRGAWSHDGQSILVDVVKAKNITHEKRRIKRDQELAPLDIAVTIPATAKTAEAARKVIRDKHDAMQIEIDACVGADELKLIIAREGL